MQSHMDSLMDPVVPDRYSAVDAVPHGFDPLAAQHSEDDHERVEEVAEMPAQLASVEVLRDVVGADCREDDLRVRNSAPSNGKRARGVCM